MPCTNFQIMHNCAEGKRLSSRLKWLQNMISTHNYDRSTLSFQAAIREEKKIVENLWTEHKRICKK